MRKKMFICFAVAVIAFSFVVVFQVSANGQTESTKSANLAKMIWISPRGTLEVMDDYNLWVADAMGYFKEMGLERHPQPGPSDAFSCTKYVDQHQADVGYPSPGVLTASVDSGMDVIMVYEMMLGQVFDFGVKKDSPIHSVKDLAGKTIALGDAGWQVIVDPILEEAGLGPKSVTTSLCPLSGPGGRPGQGGRSAPLGRTSCPVGRAGPWPAVPHRPGFLQDACQRLLRTQIGPKGSR